MNRFISPYGRAPLPCFGILVILAMAVAAICSPAAAGDNPKVLTRSEQRVVHQAQKAIAKEQYAKARQMLSAYIKKCSGSVHYLLEFTLGNALAMEGNAQGAVAHYQAATTIHPGDSAVWHNMGKAYYDMKHFARAGHSLVKAHELEDPPSPATAYQAAVAFIMAEKPDTARPLLEKLVSSEGGQPKAAWLDALLKVYLDLGLTDKALGLTRDLLGKAGHRPHLWQILAHIHMSRKEYLKAAAALEIYASLAPMDAEKTGLLGDLYMMAGVPMKAAQKFEALLIQKPSASVYEKIATAYLAAFRKDKAVEALERGIDMKASGTMWWNLASVHYEEGRFDKAYEAFGQCARHGSKTADAHLMMGYSALQANRLLAAESAFSQAARHPAKRVEAEKMRQHIKQIQANRGDTDA